MTDEELMAHFYDDDEDAFEILVARHSTPLKHHGMFLIHNWADAEDAVQETWLAVYESSAKNRFDPALGSFKGWVHSILHNHALNIHRRNCYYGRAINQQVVQYHDIRELDLFLDLVHLAAHSSLTELQKKVLNHLLEGQTVTEIAMIEGCSESAIRKLRLRAIGAMRRALQ
jgi:RNA polymerase sigma-70 factor (ECF subfamily)